MYRNTVTILVYSRSVKLCNFKINIVAMMLLHLHPERSGMHVLPPHKCLGCSCACNPQEPKRSADRNIFQMIQNNVVMVGFIISLRFSKLRISILITPPPLKALFLPQLQGLSFRQSTSNKYLVPVTEVCNPPPPTPKTHKKSWPLA